MNHFVSITFRPRGLYTFRVPPARHRHIAAHIYLSTMAGRTGWWPMVQKKDRRRPKERKRKRRALARRRRWRRIRGARHRKAKREVRPHTSDAASKALDGGVQPHAAERRARPCGTMRPRLRLGNGTSLPRGVFALGRAGNVSGCVRQRTKNIRLAHGGPPLDDRRSGSPLPCHKTKSRSLAASRARRERGKKEPRDSARDDDATAVSWRARAYMLPSSPEGP